MPLDAASLRAWRRERGLSQERLAVALGVSERFVFDLESLARPREIPKHIELAVAALTLGVTEYDGGPIVMDVSSLPTPKPKASAIKVRVASRRQQGAQAAATAQAA